jgi:hypothetical protein
VTRGIGLGIGIGLRDPGIIKEFSATDHTDEHGSLEGPPSGVFAAGLCAALDDAEGGGSVRCLRRRRGWLTRVVVAVRGWEI